MLGGPLRLKALAISIAAFACSSAATAAEPLPSVAIDLGGLDEATYAKLDGLGLEKRLVLRLVQDGFAVVAASAQADVRLSVVSSSLGLLLNAQGRTAAAQREVAIAGDGLVELHLEVAQKMVELARACAPGPAPEAPKPIPEHPAAPPPPAPIEPMFRLAAAGGVIARSGGTDLAGRLVLRYGSQLGVSAVLGLVPSFAQELLVLEGQFLLGPSFKLKLGAEADLEIGLVAGPTLHFFHLSHKEALEPTGVRLDLAAALPLTFAYWPAQAFGVGVRIAPGIASQGREHRSGEQTLWSRGSVWFEAQLALLARF